MREEEERWCARWEEELPRPEELMPLSQTLITADLALAFDIPTGSPNPSNPAPPPSSLPPPPATQPDFDAGEIGGAGGGVDEPARTLKRPRLVWTPQLHKRFVDAVASLGIKNAVPKTIMQLMSVDGLTRENVASHLQKYRLYLRRMQGLNSSSGGGGGPISAADAATDQLFASAPVPHHFLSRGPEPCVPYVPLTALQHHQHMAAAAAAAAAAQQQQFYQRHMGHFGSPTGGGAGFDHGFLARAQPQPGMHRMAGPAGFCLMQRSPPAAADSYIENLESGSGGGGGGGGRRVLTLFPTGED